MALYCFLFAALPKIWGQSEKAEMIGTVLQVNGTWRITKDSSELVAGQGVPAGALIRTAFADNKAFLVIVLLSGQRLTATCKTDPCTMALQVPAHYAETGVSFQHMIEAVKYVLLNRHPEVEGAFSSIISRGDSSTRSEMVTAFEAGEAVSLASAFSSVQKGADHLQLIRASDGKLLSNQKLPEDFPLKQAAVNLPAPGAYIVLLKSRFDDPVSDVFVAAVPSASYDHVKISFEQAQGMCAEWKGADAANSTRLFLRAYLLALTANDETGRFR